MAGLGDIKTVGVEADKDGTKRYKSSGGEGEPVWGA